MYFHSTPGSTSNVNKSIKDCFTLCFDSWTTDKKVVTRGSENQNDIGSAVKVNSAKYLIAAQGTEIRTSFAIKANNVPVFDGRDIRKFSVELDGVRYPRESIDVEYS